MEHSNFWRRNIYLADFFFFNFSLTILFLYIAFARSHSKIFHIQKCIHGHGSRIKQKNGRKMDGKKWDSMEAPPHAHAHCANSEKNSWFSCKTWPWMRKHSNFKKLLPQSIYSMEQNEMSNFFFFRWLKMIQII